MTDLWQSVKFIAELLMVAMGLATPFFVAWLRTRIQKELEPLGNDIGHVCDRLDLLEEWRAVAEFQLGQYAPALRDVTRLTAIMEQQEEVTREIRNALVQLNATLSLFGERLARNEERTKQRVRGTE